MSAQPDPGVEVIRPTLTGYTPPPPPAPLCRHCGKIIPSMAELQHPQDAYHDSCHPSRPRFDSGERIVGQGNEMRNVLVGVLRRQFAAHERSRQVAVGPSQLGERCVRRLAMQLAGVPEINVASDPWPAGVGTMIHEFNAAALRADNERLRRIRWIVEQAVEPDPAIHGTSDAFDLDTGTVLDWKTIGKPTSEVRRKLEAGELDGYHTQIQVYGLGWERLGYRPRTVALAFLGRSGMLRDMAYIEWPYRPQVAQEAIQRAYSIAGRVKDLMAQMTGRDIWSMVPCDTTGYCGWCPYFQRNAEQATANGCPGR